MQKLTMRGAVFGAALSLAVMISPAPEAAEWKLNAPLPIAMAEVSVSTDGQRVYVLGGTVQEGPDPMQAEYSSSKFLSYDPAADAWEELSPLPETVTHIGTAYLDGKIYAFGGFEAFVHMGAKSAAFAYDIAADSWSELPSMPIAVGSPAVAAIEGKIHVIGGRDAQ